MTTDAAVATKYEYLVTVRKMINGVSTNSITFAKLLSTATVTIELPTEVQVSNPPISGSFKVKCVNKDGVVSLTKDITFDHDSKWATHRIMNECSGVYDKLEELDPPNNEEYK